MAGSIELVLSLCSCAGIGSGARVAAVVGGRCRGTLAGFVLLSYPLNVRSLGWLLAPARGVRLPALSQQGSPASR